MPAFHAVEKKVEGKFPHLFLRKSHSCQHRLRVLRFLDIVTRYDRRREIKIPAASQIFQHPDSRNVIGTVDPCRTVVRLKKLLHRLVAFLLCLVRLHDILRDQIQVISFESVQIAIVAVLVSTVSDIPDIPVSQ